MYPQSRLLRALCAAAFAAAAAAPAYAQTAPSPAAGISALTIRGQVVDPDGKPIAGAELRLTDPNGRLVLGRTASEGRFAIEAPGLGRFTLQARAIGFVAAVLDVTVPTGDAPVRLRLVRQQQLSTVQVI
ncbi:carboxypeptidase-like regulatory domain-containing protein, partial [Gemmatimonas sp.]